MSDTFYCKIEYILLSFTQRGNEANFIYNELMTIRAQPHQLDGFALEEIDNLLTDNLLTDQ